MNFQWSNKDSGIMLAVWMSGIIIFTIAWLYVDMPLSSWLFLNTNLKSSVWLKVLSNLGKDVVLVSLSALCFGYYRYIKPIVLRQWQILFILASLVASNLVSLLIKVLCGRARPMLWLQHHDYGFHGLSFNSMFWSFPSGHAVSVMALVFSWSIMKPRYAWFLLPLGFCFIVTRVLLLRHFTSDIIASTLMGFTVSMLLYKGYFKMKLESVTR